MNNENKILIKDQIKDIDFDFVYKFLSHESSWQEGIGSSNLRKALENSLCISAYYNNEQVGFVRVITDYATFAWFDDLFVDKHYRGNGIARKLMMAATNHTSIKSVRSQFLSSSDAAARAIFSSIGFDKLDQTRLNKLMALPKNSSDSFFD